MPTHAVNNTAPFVSVCAEIEFREGDKEHMVEVEVLFDGVREMREAFTLHLKPDENMVAETQVRNVLTHSFIFVFDPYFSTSVPVRSEISSRVSWPRPPQHLAAVEAQRAVKSFCDK